jgi:hypothetical protein
MRQNKLALCRSISRPVSSTQRNIERYRILRRQERVLVGLGGKDCSWTSCGAAKTGCISAWDHGIDYSDESQRLSQEFAEKWPAARGQHSR